MEDNLKFDMEDVLNFYHVRYPKGKDVFNILQLRELQGCKEGGGGGGVMAKNLCNINNHYIVGEVALSK